MTAAVEKNGSAESWWRRCFITPVTRQLAQGISPGRLGWSVAAGMTLGIFPIMGSTTVLCAIAAWALGLNQPVTHLSKSVVYPLHIAMILVFIRLGQRMFGVPLLTLSIPGLMGRFKDDPARFVQDFGMAALQGVAAWLLVAPLLAVGIKFAATPLLQRVALKLRKPEEALS